MCALDSVGMQCVLADPSAHGGRLSECDHGNPLLNQQEIQPMETLHIKNSVFSQIGPTHISACRETSYYLKL